MRPPKTKQGLGNALAFLWAQTEGMSEGDLIEVVQAVQHNTLAGTEAQRDRWATEIAIALNVSCSFVPVADAHRIRREQQEAAED